MRYAIRVGRQYLATQYANMAEYRSEIILWLFAMVLPFILMGPWMTAASTGKLAMSPDQMARYFLAVFIVRQFTVVWVIWDFEYQIVEGRLSSQLLKPIDPVWNYVCMHLAEQMTRFPFWMCIVAVFLLLNPGARWTPGWTCLLAIPAIVLTFTLRFVLQYTFAMLAFWMERASAIEQLSFLPYMFLSGLVAPLAVFPPALRHLAEMTPFPYLVNFPSQLLIGGHVDAPRGFATMAAWIVVLLLLNRLLWRRGLRQYSGMGA